MSHRFGLSCRRAIACLFVLALAGCGPGGGGSGNNGPEDTGVEQDVPDAGSDTDSSQSGTNIEPCSPDETCVDGYPSFLARGEFEDPGVIKRLAVSKPDKPTGGGSDPSTYAAGHPVNVAVDIEPAEGWDTRLAGLANMHVGLIETIDPNAEDLDEARANADTCYLGALNAPSLSAERLESGNLRFERNYIIPPSCLGEDERTGFNFWVALNPARQARGEQLDIPRRFYNTQFFNALAEDTDGEGRNAECTGADGREDCVYTIYVEPSPGVNFVMEEPELESTVFPFDPGECEGQVEYSNAQARVETSMTAYGAEQFDAENLESRNAIEQAGGQRALIRFRMCPRAPDGGSEGSYIHLPTARLDSSGEPELTSVVEVDEVVVGSSRIAPYDLYLTRSADVCGPLAGTATPDWSGYNLFNLEICTETDGEEATVDGDADADNCSIVVLRKVRADDGDSGFSDISREFKAEYERTLGTDFANVHIDIGTFNRVDLDGARTRNWAELNLGGWLDATLLDSYVRGDRSIEGQSLLATYLRIFSFTLVDERRESEDGSVTFTHDTAKERCWPFQISIAGMPLNGQLCARAGLEGNTVVNMTGEQGPGSEPFQNSELLGTLSAEHNRSGVFELGASVALDAAAARAGARGEVTLADIGLQATGDLNWGLEADGAVIGYWDLGADLLIDAMDGYIELFVDVAKPGMCNGRPCRRWQKIGSKRIYDHDSPEMDFELVEAKAPAFGATFVND